MAAQTRERLSTTQLLPRTMARARSWDAHAHYHPSMILAPMCKTMGSARSSWAAQIPRPTTLTARTLPTMDHASFLAARTQRYQAILRRRPQMTGRAVSGRSAVWILEPRITMKLMIRMGCASSMAAWTRHPSRLTRAQQCILSLHAHTLLLDAPILRRTTTLRKRLKTMDRARFPAAQTPWHPISIRPRRFLTAPVVPSYMAAPTPKQTTSCRQPIARTRVIRASSRVARTVQQTIMTSKLILRAAIVPSHRLRPHPQRRQQCPSYPLCNRHLPRRRRRRSLLRYLHFLTLRATSEP
mmetsp:Transcript_36713/g.96951  ORF Transcript_36713/g.96951 Transcript_36713/m.96951 type:complete len:298 (+) Transcript_36713:2716-3609(+)